MAELTDYQRGLAEGARDALLEEHTTRLNKINGSVERHARSNEAMTKAMQQGFEKVASEIRTMQEDARLDRERVKVAAETLATETERRRDELENSVKNRAGAWSLRSDKASVVYLLIAFTAVVVAIYNVVPHH